ncbi:baculoviral IAP repeat-containing protein 5 [Prorops nasuta]|uniref:baculoviral IAP repeat-containing protein 5 n=1 Tax=Prorops nasuta TaxID=863751 RepID=UPI0034CFAA4D
MAALRYCTVHKLNQSLHKSKQLQKEVQIFFLKLNMSMDMFGKVDPIFWSSGRLKTYDNWPFKNTTKCNPMALAAAGFFKVPESSEPDLAECFICHKQLDGWEESDDPWEEHIKHNESCAFVKLGKQDELSWTVEELFLLFKEFCIKNLTTLLEKKVTALAERREELKKEIPKILKENRKSERPKRGKTSNTNK